LLPLVIDNHGGDKQYEKNGKENGWQGHLVFVRRCFFCFGGFVGGFTFSRSATASLNFRGLSEIGFSRPAILQSLSRYKKYFSSGPGAM
jgi:hypothetical protein